jgi:hypothetical protein
MKARRTTWLAGIAGLLLGFAAAWLVSRVRFNSPAPSSAHPASASVSKLPSGKPEPPRPRRVLIKTKELFNWSSVESADYHEYIANLRRIGCPEETIRDIVIADICKNYAALQKALLGQQEYRFWEPDPLNDRLRRDSASKETRRRWRELELEKRDLIRELLGVELTVELERLHGGDLEQQIKLSFLSTDKRAAVEAILARHNSALNDNAQGDAVEDAAEFQAGVKRLWLQRDAELKQVLSQEEFAELDLRISPTADDLRRRLHGFEPTEQEFRRLFSLQKAYDDRFSPPWGLEQAAEDAGPASDRLERSIRDAEYQQAQAPEYGQLYELSLSQGLGRETAAKAYTLWQQAEAAAQKIQTLATDDTAISKAEVEINTELARALKRVLGEKAFAEYQKHHASSFEIVIPPASPPEASVPETKP